MTQLLKCPNCGTIYKIIGENTDIIYVEPTNKTVEITTYITDLGGELVGVNRIDREHLVKCLKCQDIVEPEIKNVEDWVADLVFKVKG